LEEEKKTILKEEEEEELSMTECIKNAIFNKEFIFFKNHVGLFIILCIYIIRSMTGDIDTIKKVTEEQTKLLNKAIRSSSFVYQDLLNGNATNAVKKNVEGLFDIFFSII
jgi:hypothetical protein